MKKTIIISHHNAQKSVVLSNCKINDMRLSVVSTLDKTDVITRHFLIWQLPARLKLNTNKCICSAIFNADAYGSKADADTNWLTPRMHWVHLYLVRFIANILMRNVPCFQLAETRISLGQDSNLISKKTRVVSLQQVCIPKYIYCYSCLIIAAIHLQLSDYMAIFFGWNIVI